MLAHFFRASLALLCLTGFAAGQGTTEDAGPAKLRWKWKVGQELRYRSRSLQKQTVTGPRSLELEVEQTLTWHHKVKSIDELGVATLVTRYQSIQYRMKHPSGDVLYDSRKDRIDDPNLSPFVLYFPAMVNKPFELAVDARGKIRSIAGFDKIRSAMIANLEKDAMAARQSEALASRYSDATIMQEFQRLYRLANSLPVKPGDGWDRAYKMEAAGVGKTAIKDRFTYLETTVKDARSCAKIGVKSSTILEVESLPPGWKMKLEDAKSQGEVLFDEAAGTLVGYTSKNGHTLKLTAPPGMRDLSSVQKLEASLTVTALPLTESDRGQEDPKKGER